MTSVRNNARVAGFKLGPRMKACILRHLITAVRFPHSELRIELIAKNFYNAGSQCSFVLEPDSDCLLNDGIWVFHVCQILFLLHPRD